MRHRFSASLIVVIMLAVVSHAGCNPRQTSGPLRALLVIFGEFEEDEYGDTRAALEGVGVEITIASSTLEVVTGHGGTEVRPDLLLGEAQASDYDAVVFVGGYAYERENEEALRLAKEAFDEGKVLGAICVAPITLAKAGVLQGKRATTSLSGSVIEAEGAIYTGRGVERDGLIITAKGPYAAADFGATIVEALSD